MPLSDQMVVLSDKLTSLSARAKETEEHVAASRSKAKDELHADIEAARGSAQARAQELRVSAETNKPKLSVWWYDLQRTWNEHVAKIREDIDAKRAGHDAGHAQRRAERRVSDAMFAVEFAYAAIEEAEYAVLDAELAAMEAAELSAA